MKPSLLITILAFTLLLAGTAVAQATVVRNEAIVDFPREIVFELALPAGHDVTQATLSYEVQKASCLDAVVDVPVAVDGDVARWPLIFTRAGNMPPGARLTWQWTLTGAGGAQTTTPPQTVTVTDDRFAWRTLEAEGIRLHWYAGDHVGPLLLDAAVEGLHRLETEMGIELQDEVQIFIYGSSADMRDALLYVQEWAGGVAFTEFNVILLGVPPNQADSWGVQVTPHELAHLVIGQYGRSCVGGSRPTWLEEGLAVYAEGPPDENIRADIARGVSQNAFEPLRSLGGAFSSDHTQAGMAYSQSYSVVNYMLEAHGQEKMQDLLLALAAGATIDEALMQIYGVNVDGLEAQWREAIGAPPRDIPPTPTPLSAAAVPTYAPSGLPQDLPTPPSAAAPPPAAPQQRPSPGICGLGLLLPLAAVSWRRRRDEA